MWYDFRSDYTYCRRCGCLLEDYLLVDDDKFCSHDCMYNYIKANTIRYPYGVLYEDEMYNSMDILYKMFEDKVKYFD